MRLPRLQRLHPITTAYLLLASVILVASNVVGDLELNPNAPPTVSALVGGEWTIGFGWPVRFVYREAVDGEFPWTETQTSSFLFVPAPVVTYGLGALVLDLVVLISMLALPATWLDRICQKTNVTSCFNLVCLFAVTGWAATLLVQYQSQSRNGKLLLYDALSTGQFLLIGAIWFAVLRLGFDLANWWFRRRRST